MKSEFNLIEGGHFQKKGYWYRLFMVTPEFDSCETITVHKKSHKVKKILFNSGILLTSNSSYVNIKVMILGFGIGFEIHNYTQEN